MSEQVKRWAMWRAIEELGPDDWVVRDTCYDALAQRCRDLEAKCARTEQARAGWEENATLLELERDTLRAEKRELIDRLKNIVTNPCESKEALAFRVGHLLEHAACATTDGATATP